jgi:energy-coupling factor transport system substrate-specific component
LWSWPFITGPVEQYWEPGITWLDAINRYAVYYLVTSLVWDLARTAGNFIFILIFGGPTLRALRRFRSKFSFQYELAQQLKPDLEHKGQLE